MNFTPEQKIAAFIKEHPECRMLTLAGCRDWVEAHRHEGLKCPCCTQFLKVYQRTMNARQAIALINLFKHTKPGTFAHVDDFKDPSNEISKLRYWGLVEEKPVLSGTVKKRSGYWSITERGCRFVQHKILVPKYAVVHLRKLQRLEGPMISIHQVLGEKFNLKELMKPVAKG